MPTVAVLPFYRVGATPLALEIMRIYNAGSSVYASVYTDTNGTIPMGNSDLVPIQADANGLFPVVFVPVGAAYDIKFYDSTLHPRDTYQGIRPTSGGGSAVDVYLVKTSATDTNGGYLGDKLLNSSSVSWSIVNAGGYEQIQATVNPAYVLDWKVKTDAGDSTPDYLGNKIESGMYVALTLDAATHKIKASFTGPAYVPQAGGSFTGPVTFGNTIMAVGGCFFGDTIVNGAMTISGDISGHSAGFTGVISANGLQLPGIAGSGSWLTIDGAGNVTRTSAPVNDRMVLHDVGDLIPGYLGTKIVAGTGITINTTTDGVNGVVMHINSNAVPAVSQPANQVVVGTGSGITSFSGLKGTANSLTAGLAYISTSSSQPSCAYIGTVGGDPGGGNTVGLLVNTTNLLLYSSSSGWIKAQVGGSTTLTLDNSLMDVYSAATKLRGTVQMTGIPGVGSGGTLVADTAGNVSAVSGYLTGIVPFSSYYAFGSSTAIFTMTSVTLTVGTWEVEGQISYNIVGSFQGVANIQASNTAIINDGFDAYTPSFTSYSGSVSSAIARRRYTVSSGTQIIYLVALATGSFSGGRAWGNISAKQVA